MPVSKSVSDSRGFTTDYFGRCAICKEPIAAGIPDHSRCNCGAYIFPVTPTPKQRQLIDAFLATGREVPTRIGFGGSRGAAKSRGLRDAALVVASEVSQTLFGILIYIVRTVWGDVERNHLKEFELERPELMQFYVSSQSSKEFHLPAAMGGARIAFGYGDTFKDLRRFTRGPNIYLVLIDQAEGFTEPELDELHTPNRWPAAGPGGAKTGYFFNPGGPGSDFLKKVFYKKDFRATNLNADDFKFIQGYGWDNFRGWFINENISLNGVALDEESFFALPGEVPPCPSGVYDNAWLAQVADYERFKIFVTQTSEGRKMWQKPDSIRMGELFGRFDSFAGQAFAGVWDERKVVIR